jgi:magnesium-protoporphyrin O-methyltransferase
MAGCCDPRGCDRIFDDRFAKRMAARYRKKGLDKTARRMVALLPDNDVRGATLLEIGGGVGEIGLELLRRGAARRPATDTEAVWPSSVLRASRGDGSGDEVAPWDRRPAVVPETLLG